MPDKEFDNLFRDKFNEAEIEPSANLWANIEKQLAPTPKRVIPIFWMAAASIAVILTSLLVFQKTEKIQLRGTDEMANVIAPKKDRNIIANTITTDVKEVEAVSTPKFVSNTVESKSVKSSDNYESENNSANIQLAVQPIKVNDRLPIKQAAIVPLDILEKDEKAIVPIAYTASVQSENISDAPTNDVADTNVERRGIRNVGDIVNYVVDKVDKRDKKLVRFNTDDDDNSSIIGINIGFLKLNSRKHNK